MISELLFKGIDVTTYIFQNPLRVILKYSKNIRVIKDIIYYDDDSFCKMDIYIPDTNKKKYSVTIIIHGGGFVAGFKEARNALSYYCCKKTNNIILNVEYGKSPKNTFLESIKELSYLFDFIIKYKDNYYFDLDNINIMGDSSGAYFALYLTNLTHNTFLQDSLNIHPLVKIKKTVLNSGFYDYESIDLISITKPVVDELLKYLTHEEFKDIKEYKYYDLINPINHIQNNNVKYLIGYSKNDSFCNGQSQLLVKRLNEMNIKSKILCSTDLIDNHCYSLFWVSSQARRFNKALIRFLK